MHEKEWRVLDRQLIYDGAPWVQLHREKVELPTGHVIDDFYQVRLPDFVVIFAVTGDGQLVMVRGYKHGMKRLLLSPPAGMIEQGEDPSAAAQRELLEETGYKAILWKKLGEFVTDGNRHCGTMHLFYAGDATQVQSPEEDSSESLECELHDVQSVTKALMNGEIGNLPGATATAVGLLFLQQNQAEC